jgi:nucleotide-binding universal stress UspA family protein
MGIAKKCGSSLFVISVASTDTEIALAAGNVKKVTGMAERENIHIEGIAVKGKPYEAIIETAKQKRADLIIMGSHGRTGLERLLMGSVTERVIGHSEVAVLVVKA